MNPTGAVSIGGTAFTLGSGGIDMSTATQNMTITFGATSATGMTLGASQTWAVNTGVTLTVNSFINGTTSSITKTGGGTLSLPTTSNNTGGYGTNITALTILGGTVTMPNGNSLGNATTSTPNNVIINNGTLQFSTSNTLNANRGIGLGSAGGTIDTPTGVAFIINGSLADAFTGTAGGLTKTGPGTLTLGNNTTATNTYTGPTLVQAGILATIGRASAFGDSVSGTTVNSGAAVQVTGNIMIPEPLTLNGTGVSNAGALDHAANTTTWSGAITVATASRINSDASTLTITNGIAASGAGQDLTVGGAGNTIVNTAGIATGTGQLTKDGAGTLTLSATNTYTGNTTVSAGTLTLTGSATIASPAISVATNATLDVSGVTSGFVLNSGQALKGTGTVKGTVTAASGSSIVPGGSPGILAMTGAVTLQSGSSLFVTINGNTTPGTDYSQLNLNGTGTIDLGGANLTGTFGYLPNSIDQITIITGGTVSGVFAGNTTFTFGGFTGQIQYNGNAVVLTGFTPVPAPTLVLLTCGGVAAGVSGWRRRRTSIDQSVASATSLEAL
jgi:autotransporter-associated beta strand protein